MNLTKSYFVGKKAAKSLIDISKSTFPTLKLTTISVIFFMLFSWIEDDIFEKIKHLTSKIINTSFSFVKILPLLAYDSSSADYYTSMRLVKAGEGAAEAVSGLDSFFQTFFLHY